MVHNHALHKACKSVDDYLTIVIPALAISGLMHMLCTCLSPQIHYHVWAASCSFHWMQRAESAFIPATLSDARSSKKHSAGDQRRIAAEHTADSMQRSPERWTREEAYYRTGSFKGMGADPWQATALGGSDVCRPLHKYAADEHTFNTARSCQKAQPVMRRLIPGCMFYWCTLCGLCVCFHVMANAESPKTVFDTLYTKWQHAPPSFCMDNGCNVHHYILNREPGFFRDTKIFIDQSHYHGHKDCSAAYNTGNSLMILSLSLNMPIKARLHKGSSDYRRCQQACCKVLFMRLFAGNPLPCRLINPVTRSTS